VGNAADTQQKPTKGKGETYAERIEGRPQPRRKVVGGGRSTLKYTRGGWVASENSGKVEEGRCEIASRIDLNDRPEPPGQGVKK